MARLKPSIRSTETYTESNFLRVQTQALKPGDLRVATIEHLCYDAEKAAEPHGGWHCHTIVDFEEMSKEDALFIAKAYALENGIPVIYESHAD